MSIILALLIFSAIVLFHELGHFLLAKKSGIVVTEFALGMGPRLWSMEKGGTRYSLKVLPFGGSCSMLGEDTDEENVPGTFNAASVWGRIATVAAGPIFNFVLAFVLSLIIVGFSGYAPAEVVEVADGSSAEAAGLQAGDIITEFEGYHIDIAKDLYVYSYLNEITEDTVDLKVRRDGQEIAISYTPDVNIRYLMGFNRSDTSSMVVASLIAGMPLDEAGVQAGDEIIAINGEDVSTGEKYEAYINAHPLGDEPIEVTFVRDGLEYDITITPEEYRTPVMGFSYNVGNVKAKGLEVIKYGALEVKYMVRTTILSLKELFSGSLGMDDLSGPVGVVDAIGDTYEESKEYGLKYVILNMLSMAVMLSANLGVMNLLPVPALDGGRLVFLILEVIRRKPVNRNVEGMVHFAGIVVLMMLMVVIMYNDILKIF